MKFLSFVLLSFVAALLAGCANLPPPDCQVRGSTGTGAIEGAGRGVSGEFCIFSLYGACEMDWYMKMKKDSEAVCEAGNLTPGAAHAIRRVRSLDRGVNDD
jgi:hypothetical protein